jgi:hypothetical protein
MPENAHFVQGVQGLCRVLCRGFRSCAGCAGSTRHTCARKHHHHTATTNTFRKFIPLHTLHTLHKLSKSTTYKKKKVHKCLHTMHTPITPEPTTRTIRCTPDNEADFRALLAEWPELRAYVKDLHTDGLLSGLRAISITLTGTPAAVAGGVGAVRAARASMAPKTQPEETPCKSV